MEQGHAANFMDHAAAAATNQVRDFVLSNGGHTVITNILIATNGLAAVKGISSMRQWAYEMFDNERAIRFTVMATPEDLEANANYIRMADHYVEVPGGSSNNNYANVDLIVDIAERMGVHAVWPGWGHASENPRLPERLASSTHDIAFVGPSVSSMRLLGDKVSSMIIAQRIGIPCLPWSGDLVEDTNATEIDILEVSDHIYDKACAHSAEEGLGFARKIGFPVMIKASEGGGGKGMRRAEDEQSFIEFFHAAAGEVVGSPVSIMKLASGVRHIEVQLVADEYGNVTSLSGRDCTVQRRHQKIIEEAPALIVRPDILASMERSAILLAKLVKYTSVGTVEYLYSPAEETFYFLELNPRLQVEHPITEMLAGTNIPAAQLQIAMGLSLHRIIDIRTLFYSGENAASTVDLHIDRRRKLTGHVIACRITAEDASDGFKPSSGLIHELDFRSGPDVWGYFSVTSSGGVHSFSDSQFGHIFARGESRETARKRMVGALKTLSIQSNFGTTAEHLVELLQTSEFRNHAISTSWLDDLKGPKFAANAADWMVALICGAISKAHAERGKCLEHYHSSLARGQVLPAKILKTRFSVDFVLDGVQCKPTVDQSGPESYVVSLNGSKVETDVKAFADGALSISFGGQSFHVCSAEYSNSTRISISGKSHLLEQKRDPTQLRTKSPGKLTRYTVQDGTHIRRGQPFAELEIMKMRMPLIAAYDGRIKIRKLPGSILEAGDLVANLELDDPGAMKPIEAFAGQLPSFGSPRVAGASPTDRLTYFNSVLQHIMDGFGNEDKMKSSLDGLIEVLRSSELPYSDWAVQLAALRAQVPPDLRRSLASNVEKSQKAGSEFPAESLLRTYEQHLTERIPSNNVETLRAALLPLEGVMRRYQAGLKQHEFDVILSLLQQYYLVERHFSHIHTCDEEAVLQLRETHRDNIDLVVKQVQSHANSLVKGDLVIAVLEAYRSHQPNVGDVASKFRVMLENLTSLKSGPGLKVALKSREILLEYSVVPRNDRIQYIADVLCRSVEHSPTLQHRPDPKHLRELIEMDDYIDDVLSTFFARQDTKVVLAALEVYVCRTYPPRSIRNLKSTLKHDFPIGLSWDFGGASQRTHGSGLSVSDTGPTALNGPGPTKGAVVAVSYLADVGNGLKNIFRQFPLVEHSRYAHNAALISDVPEYGTDESMLRYCNICSIFIRDVGNPEHPSVRNQLSLVVSENKEQLQSYGIRRLVFICSSQNVSGFTYYTFYGPQYEVIGGLRHIDPALVSRLQLDRLSGFDITPITTPKKNVHLFEATNKLMSADKRYFACTLMRSSSLPNVKQPQECAKLGLASSIARMLDAMEVACSNDEFDMNHLLIDFAAPVFVTPGEVRTILLGILERYESRLRALHITEVELCIICQNPNTEVVRLTATNVSGHSIQVDLYAERESQFHGIDGFGSSLDGTGEVGKLHLRSTSSPYPAKSDVQFKRHKAHMMGAQYAYDLPDLFRHAVDVSWSVPSADFPDLSSLRPTKAECLKSSELIFDVGSENLVEVTREAGKNSIGMLSWTITAKTPEYPKGRRFVLISHDITFQSGSVGPLEEIFFAKSSELARKLGIPRVYVSANSGARITIADRLLPHFSVAWREPKNPHSGFKYFYLTPEKARMMNDAITEKIIDEGEERHKITAIVGSEKDRGEPVLRGFGKISRETSRAYEDVFTITLVTCRSVGIGAYLVRLGQRTIQVEGRPIILTGAQAINHVLGRPIYSSNLQLGGTQVMCKNGVTHLTARDDFDGIHKLLSWLSYVPDKKDNPGPVLPTSDDWDRDITFTPPKKATYDVRWLIEGKHEANSYLTGLFDRGSFHETLQSWAPTVVVGRARLGGIPIGVIAVENRSTTNISPADPANPSSAEQVTLEAGGIWTASSADKTAQALRDFNHGEQLPVLILANWRGFSGGQHDMQNGILQFGARLLDSLVRFRQPVFVYLPPGADVRGGAWVVIDPALNPACVETYADEEARGGVLEPAALVSVKFRRERQLELMERLDEVYEKLKARAREPGLTEEERKGVREQVEARARLLAPVYTQIGVRFAELQDSAARMRATGAIRSSLRWRDARRFFYWRLRRRLGEEAMLKRMNGSSEMIDMTKRQEYLDLLKEWSGVEDYDSADREVAEWCEMEKESIIARIAELRKTAVAREVEALILNNREGGLEGLVNTLSSLGDEVRKHVLGRFK